MGFLVGLHLITSHPVKVLVNSLARSFGIDVDGKRPRLTSISLTQTWFISVTRLGTSQPHFQTIKKIDTGADTVTLTPYAAEKIDGAASVVLTTQYDTVQVFTNGTHWYRLDQAV